MSKEKTARDAIEGLMAGYEKLGYVSDEQIATALFLAQQLEKPLLVEGPPGVGKTELAKATAEYLGLDMIRLQCYEGLDEAKALYEWQYGKQLLYTQVLKEKLGDLMEGAATLDQSMDKLHDFEDVFFSEQFLQTRPLLEALRADDGIVLLIDEIDKSDDEFEAFLLEILSDYQISIPRIGHGESQKAAAGIFDLEQYARDWRCAEAALPASLYSVSRCGARKHHIASSRARAG
jgi:MoxR-like ATPase